MVIKYRPQTCWLPGRQTADMFVHRQQNEQKTKSEGERGREEGKTHFRLEQRADAEYLNRDRGNCSGRVSIHEEEEEEEEEMIRRQDTLNLKHYPVCIFAEVCFYELFMQQPN